MRFLAALAGTVVLALVIVKVVTRLTSNALHDKSRPLPSKMLEAPRPGHDQAIAEARRLVRRVVLKQGLPGVSVAVGVGDQLVWAEGFGWANIERRVQVTPLTRFRIGSIAKALTSAAAGLLHERGALDLDAPVQQYVPTFPRKQWPVTTRQLLGHVVGIGPEGKGMPLRRCTTLAEALTIFADEPLAFEPGTRYRPSIYGYILASAVIEGASKQRYHEFMQRELFDPLGMKSTTPDAPEVPERAFPYFPKMAEDPRYGVQTAPEADYSCYAGAGAFVSTPSDLVRFGLAVTSGKLLKPETVTLLQTPLKLPEGKPADYGLGWTLAQTPSGRFAGHGGTPIGGTASFLTAPEHGVVVAVTSNVSNAEGVRPLAQRIAEAFIAEKQRARPATGAAADRSASASTAGGARDAAATPPSPAR